MTELSCASISLALRHAYRRLTTTSSRAFVYQNNLFPFSSTICIHNPDVTLRAGRIYTILSFDCQSAVSKECLR